MYNTPERYYVVLELPFDTLLVHYLAYVNFSDAEDLMDDHLPWFSIWTASQVEAWEGTTILIPAKSTRNKNDTFILKVSYDMTISAKSSFIAHKKTRKTINKLEGIKNLKTRIVNRKINLRNKDG